MDASLSSHSLRVRSSELRRINQRLLPWSLALVPNCSTGGRDVSVRAPRGSTWPVFAAVDHSPAPPGSLMKPGHCSPGWGVGLTGRGHTQPPQTGIRLGRRPVAPSGCPRDPDRTQRGDRHRRMPSVRVPPAPASPPRPGGRFRPRPPHVPGPPGGDLDPHSGGFACRPRSRTTGPGARAPGARPHAGSRGPPGGIPPRPPHLQPAPRGSRDESAARWELTNPAQLAALDHPPAPPGLAHEAGGYCSPGLGHRAHGLDGKRTLLSRPNPTVRRVGPATSTPRTGRRRCPSCGGCGMRHPGN